ncbi:isopentenyl-diphosphate Delta-isomerase [Brumimicrobium glaciale]|uniref:Isopentenyl-diphosphate delta-isomerase n=1 Tax=Brumimicrobium glaciale TaxID=200475 RepID=A0A4Q4KKN0_9FLAO|nr:isopentenyl-diphosphate Delta-isomerase [Brumimicrobium glaciale]RYM33901.1 isopentenyl-diphosphate Delta-isomerase [Brumimicrobium glaciale]
MELTGTKNVVLVDENDHVLGTMEKLQAHQEGRLHRAFSVIIFNDNDEMLIHKRASDKYHCGGLWTNACCSHPRLNEAVKDAALRRMQEEMGFTTSIEYIGQFIYKTEFENGLIEHELDHLFMGKFNGEPKPNPEEVEDFKYIGIDELKLDIEKSPQNYTVWFKKIVADYVGWNV